MGQPKDSTDSLSHIAHWTGAMLYYETKDIVYVKGFLGYKKITNILRYVQLEAAVFGGAPDEYISKVAKTIDEARQLIEAGFDYVTQMDELSCSTSASKRKVYLDVKSCFCRCVQQGLYVYLLYTDTRD